MSPSATGFELAFLRAIWIGTGVLCVASIAIMLVLVVRRAASSADAQLLPATRPLSMSDSIVRPPVPVAANTITS